MALSGSQNPIVIAHRGASGSAPENTLPAFELAARMGAEWIELDARRTLDGKIVVFHDDALDRITGQSGKLEETEWGVLSKLNAAHAFAGPSFGTVRIPTLEEALACIRSLGAGVVVELKSRGIAREALAAVRKAGFGEKAIVSSFKLEELRAVRSASADQRIGAISIMGYNRRTVLETLKADSVHLWIGPALTRAVLNRAHADGLKVFSWTANTERQVRRALRLGADGFFTNHPDKAKSILERRIGRRR